MKNKDLYVAIPGIAFLACALLIFASDRHIRKERERNPYTTESSQAAELEVTHLSEIIHVFVVEGHEYLENSERYGGGLRIIPNSLTGNVVSTSITHAAILHTESCPCHEGRTATAPEVREYHAEEIYKYVWKVTYNGHDYLTLTPYAGSTLVHMPSCPCQTKATAP